MKAFLTFYALNTIFSRAPLWPEVRAKPGLLVLDAGCGKNSHISLVTKRCHFNLVGLDIFRPDLERARRNNAYDDTLVGDVTYLPFKDNCFDIAAAIHVVEHLEKPNGDKMLCELERVSKWLVLVACPVGKFAQDAYGGNPYQEHKYVWSIEELQEKGFKEMRGTGLKGMSGRRWSVAANSLLGPLVNILTLLGTLLSYRIPKIGAGVVTWKDVRAVSPELIIDNPR
jgi:SAM-dependent methyltransferase